MLQYEWIVRLGVFGLGFVLIAAWEVYRPTQHRTLPKGQRWRTNLGMAGVNALVLRLALPTTAIAVAILADQQGVGLLNQVSMPLWLRCVVAVVMLDLAIYFQHVLFHAVPMLSRLHLVHHADQDFDVSTGVRFHPLEMVLSSGIKMAAIVALGAPALGVLVFELLLNATSLFNHANASLPPRLERAVRKLVVTPDMHRIHHSVTERERNSNYGFCLSVWDRLLGTYRAQCDADLVIGLSAYRDPAVTATLSGGMQMPFRQVKLTRPCN